MPASGQKPSRTSLRVISKPMPTNLEIKARINSLKAARKVAGALRARSQGILRQTDTYFKVKEGRLKLREINGNRLELIYYRRENSKGNRYSDYIVVDLTGQKDAKQILKAVFETTVVVKKKRELSLFRNSRIHIDSVADLGGFIEFEVLVTKGKKQAQALMSFLRREFRVQSSSLIAGSYSNMMRRR
jgi:adenylate cyclase class IV